MKFVSSLAAALGLFIFSVQDSAAGKAVYESARQIPIAYEVDVAVIGGSAAGVAAAVEAAQNGASVFLAAPRPYLGEDLCAPYRLRLAPGEEPDTPLTKALFAEPESAVTVGEGMPFQYEANRPSDPIHKDSSPPSKLNDGKAQNASSQSVQYADDVTIIADLGKRTSVGTVHVLAYQRNGEFSVEGATISISDDKNSWNRDVFVENEQRGLGGFEESAIDLAADINREARYVRFQIERGSDARRILLAEIVIEPQSIDQPKPKTSRIPPTPMQIKFALDRALLDAGVQFLYSCCATDILYDDKGQIAGFVMVNRSGRQAVIAKTVIDAMPRAEIARKAVEFQTYPAGNQTFQRIVVGGEPAGNPSLAHRAMPSKVNTKSREYTATEYTLTLPMKDGSFASFAEADQTARDLTWQDGQVNASEVLFQTPPDPMRGRKSVRSDWPGAGKIDLDAFRPPKEDHLFILNGCADISREAAEQLLRPLNLIAVGTRIGRAAAAQAESRTALAGVHLPGGDVSDALPGAVCELLYGVRPISRNTPSIPAGERALPVLGEYDVVVIGGGTGGAPAGIGAARQGAKTLVVEYLHGLGGVGTLGLIGKYYYGYREGFTKEVDEGVAAISKENAPSSGWIVEDKMEWYRRELRKAGADIWFGALGVGAYVVDGKVKGAVVATPEGRGVILANVTIDSTGSADIAIAAGADYDFTGAEHAALQGTGLPPRQPGASYTNTDYTFVDDTDPVDLWRSFVVAKEKFAGAYDLGQIVDTRERRRIIGDFIISPLDIINKRTFPDTVNIAYSNFDTHGYTVHPQFMIKSPDKVGVHANTPYRALLPKGLDGIIVTGLGVSAHRDAMPILRMQPCIQNQGYAMGVAASMAAKENKPTRGIDIKELQKHLIDKGSLPPSVLTDQDSYPLPDEKIQEAVQNAADEYQDLPILLSQPERSLPLLRRAYLSSEEIKSKLEDQTRTRLSPPGALDENDPTLIYAHILGMLGDSTGGQTLIDVIEAQEWDEGWRFTGMGQFGGSVSRLDSLLIALGRTGDPRALPIVLEKVKSLSADDAFSHHRAVAMALEALGDSKAAKPLADLLQKPEMSGHAFTDIDKARQSTPKGFSNDNTTREKTLRELVLARALYRCGDYQGLGEKILRQYERDLRGHLARHAHAVLNEK
ncbi:MAG: FAD-dependent oxidoreductase [Candidatus Omnitrophica bacterium]|nr:FAD-dependent oxidoreductase [Candidatus Omnitrophota bacterium]